MTQFKMRQVGERFEIDSPTQLPNASAFLWNKKMMLQVSCRGYATAQHMQPEPAKYSHGPCLEAKTFMQPEQAYYAHHPGRFIYIKDEDSQEIFSVPYDPSRKHTDSFVFSVGREDIEWRVEHKGIILRFSVSLPTDDAVELWNLSIENTGKRMRRLSVYPHFSIGYMSWMNQSACYRDDLGGIVASSVSPYQKLEDYALVKNLKDKSFFLHDTKPCAWEANLQVFEGEGGLHRPSAIVAERLSNSDAHYETPTAVLQYSAEVSPGEGNNYRFLFGPAKTDEEIRTLRRKYFHAGAFEREKSDYRDYLKQGEGCLKISTPDKHFDHFVNQWLSRQVFYHGDVNRLTTDPQTRNYLQDNMGMSYIDPSSFRHALLTALAQQEANGTMPDGILLHPDAQLKYVNQIPHMDHSVWLPVCLQAYLDETNDYELLSESVISSRDNRLLSVFDRISAAMTSLKNTCDHRGLSLIAQGDWCDPMNMVGPRGLGVSAWLSQASAYAFKLWADICSQRGEPALAALYRSDADRLCSNINAHFWDGEWYGRGISDDGIAFGVKTDIEGRIFLNPQSWAILCGSANTEQIENMLAAIDEQLLSPFGVEMLAPAYTKMHEHIGRVTQKSAGSAENGSVYNHAAIFYVFALYKIGEGERAFSVLRKMIPGPDNDDYRQRGQLPVFIPNYYRGASKQFPRTAGRSSQLFNTGTVSWFYRVLIEGLFGVVGCAQGLKINPCLPSGWRSATIQREFRGARFTIVFVAEDISVDKKMKRTTKIYVDGAALEGNVVTNIEKNQSYDIRVEISA